MPESAAANIRNRSYAIAVDVDVQTPEAEGVLFSHGARFGGHALYIKDRRLKYVYNFVGLNEQTIESTSEVPTGHSVLSAVFEREGDLVGEGLNVGKDPAEPITDDYPGTRPYAFTGGTIRHAIVDVSGEPYLDLERAAAAIMSRE